MKLSHYAKQQGISYRTAFAGFGMVRLRAIRLRRERSSSTPHEPVAVAQNVAIYARVSSRMSIAVVRLPLDTLVNCVIASYYAYEECKRHMDAGYEEPS